MGKIWFSVGGSGGLDWQGHLEVAQACDELGFYGFYCSDHLMPIADHGGTSARLDAPTTLAGLAGRTTRLRLGCLVQANLLRHPVVSALMLNTLDHASDGRAEFGLGAGGGRREYDVHGFPYPGLEERLGRLDEALELIKLLWTQERTTYEGRYFQVHDAPFHPRPIQEPHPPIIVGGAHPGTMKIAAKHADEWNFLGPRLVARELIGSMRDICREAGRDFATLRISQQMPFWLTDDKAEAARIRDRQVSGMTASPRFKLPPQYASAEAMVDDRAAFGDAATVTEKLQAWVGIGVTHINFMTPRPFERQMLEQFAAKVMPAFQ